jgi:hypothetical protein
MKPLAPTPDARVKPTPYDADLAHDRAPFDSVPGEGFDSEPAASAIVPSPGKIAGSGPLLLVDPAQNNAFRAINRAWDEGGSVLRLGRAYAIAGLTEAAQNNLVKSLALDAQRVRAGSAGDSASTIKRPRLGVFQPWTGSMDEGWTRWVLEQYGFKYIAVHPEDFKAPLDQKIDVLVLADDARVPVAGAGGGRGGRGGGIQRPEYAYQLTADDLQRFEAFVRGGGTVICLNNASNFVVQQLKLPIRNAIAGLRPEEFFLRGSIVEVDVDAAHPVMAGMPEKAAVFVDSSPVFEPLEGARFNGAVLAKYQAAGSPLRSGYLIGEEHVNGKAAALDVVVGAGHAVLLGFRPEWRGQPFGTFKVLFNAALYGSSPGR